MIGSARLPQYRAALESLGLLMFPDTRHGGLTGHHIYRADMTCVGFFDTTPDGVYRNGWIDTGTGRFDCLSWPEFHIEAQGRTR